MQLLKKLGKVKHDVSGMIKKVRGSFSNLTLKKENSKKNFVLSPKIQAY